MILKISFSVPFTRSQIRTALVNRANFLPVGATVTVRSTPFVLDIDATAAEEDAEIALMTVDGFTTISEVATFLESLPASVNTRFSEISLTS